ncbi:MAG: hypothetical protein DRI65_00725 [Chloroflexota bacterium]|nr:MAG: hypothetical protein DRI65_00725 [Chloroflexota bacterium]
MKSILFRDLIHPYWERLSAEVILALSPLQSESPWLILGVSLAAGLVVILIVYTISLRRLLRKHSRSLQESEEKLRRFFITSKDQPSSPPRTAAGWMPTKLLSSSLAMIPKKNSFKSRSARCTSIPNSAHRY